MIDDEVGAQESRGEVDPEGDDLAPQTRAVGPDGAGQEAIYEGIPNAERHVIAGSNHSTVFDNTAEHNRVVIDFFLQHSGSR